MCAEEICEEDKELFGPCGHSFHSACIVKWQRPDCPLCRELRPEGELAAGDLEFIGKTFRDAFASQGIPVRVNVTQGLETVVLQPRVHHPGDPSLGRMRPREPEMVLPPRLPVNSEQELERQLKDLRSIAQAHVNGTMRFPLPFLEGVQERVRELTLMQSGAQLARKRPRKD